MRQPTNTVKRVLYSDVSAQADKQGYEIIPAKRGYWLVEQAAQRFYDRWFRTLHEVREALK